jgi:hypothetical protein
VPSGVPLTQSGRVPFQATPQTPGLGGAPAPAVAASSAATARAAEALSVSLGGLHGQAGTDFASPFTVEVSEVVHDPELDEAVIAFANADFEQCEQSLTALTHGGSRAQHAETWLVLFDLYRATGQQHKFEGLALEYAQQFGWSAPQWLSLPKLVAEAAQADRPHQQRVAAGEIGWICPDTLDIEAVSRLRSVTLQLPLPWVFDWSGLKSVDPEAATHLSELFRQWSGESLDMRWLSGERFLAVLADASPTGVKDADPAYWVLRLDALRLANRPDQFDEAAIDYHGTTILSVRRGRSSRSAATARSPGQHRHQGQRARKVRGSTTDQGPRRFSPAARPTPSRCSSASRPSSTSTRAPAARRGRAGQGLAHRPRAAPAGGHAGGGRPRAFADHHRQRRRARARARHRGHRLGGAYAQAAARALLENTELDAAGHRRKSLEIAGDLCIYTNQNHITIEVLDAERRDDPDDPPGDRLRARPPHRRPGRPSAPWPSRCATAGAASRWPSRCAQRDHAEEHPDDRPHRRGQDRDRAPPGTAGRRALHQGRGDQVHRGRLRRPDVDTIIRDLVEIAVKQAREQEMKKVRARAEDAAEERVLDALLPPARAQSASAPSRRQRRAPESHRAPEIPQEAARRRARRQGDRDRGGRAPMPAGDHGPPGHGGDGRAAAGHVPATWAAASASKPAS